MPARAASIENGSPLVDSTVEDGGLTRVKELVVNRRRDSIPIRLCFGERPAGVGAEDGSARRLIPAVGVTDSCAFFFCPACLGISNYCAGWGGAGAAKSGTPLDLVVSKSKARPFFMGDENMSGSMFSESTSSNSAGA